MFTRLGSRPGLYRRDRVRVAERRRIMRRLLPPVAAIAALTAATAAFGAANDTAYLHVSRSVYVGDQAHVVLQPAPAGLCRITVSKVHTRMRAKREVRQ